MLILEGHSFPLQGYSVSICMNMHLQFRYLIPCPFIHLFQYLTIVSFVIVSIELHDYQVDKSQIQTTDRQSSRYCGLSLCNCIFEERALYVLQFPWTSCPSSCYSLSIVPHGQTVYILQYCSIILLLFCLCVELHSMKI